MQQINHTLSYENLGTHWHVLLYDEISIDHIQALNSDIQSYLGTFEKMYSRFRADSIVSQLSNEGVIDTPSQELISMFNFALDIEEKSEGYFSILLADTLTYSGYGQHTGQAPKKIPLLKDVLTITPDKITLAPGYRVDFGGFGKGWAVDAVADIVTSHGVQKAVINGGGDIRVLDVTDPYSIVLEDPFQEGNSIGTINITHGGCAASSGEKRKWIHAGKTHHHLIDPHTQESVKSEIIAVHTYTKNTLMADITSTILYVCPIAKIESLSKKLGVEYMLIFNDYSTIRSKEYPYMLS